MNKEAHIPHYVLAHVMRSANPIHLKQKCIGILHNGFRIADCLPVKTRFEDYKTGEQRQMLCNAC